MLEVKEISKSYYNKKVLNSLSFNVKKGEVFGLLGVNGAGKTTALDIISGVLRPDSGEVRIDGIGVKEDSVGYKNKIGYLPEKPPLYDYMTVHGYLEFVCKAKGVKKDEIKDIIAEIAEEVKIKNVLTRIIGHLSKGYRQRIGFAQAVVGHPDILILDEPTSGLDPVQISEVNGVIRKLCKNAAVVLSSHVLAEVSEVCDRVLIIDSGNTVAEGKPFELTREFGGKEFITFRIDGDAGEIIPLFETENIEYSLLNTDAESCIIEFEVSGINNAEFFIGKLLFDGGFKSFTVVEKRYPTLNDVFLNVVKGKEG